MQVSKSSLCKDLPFVVDLVTISLSIPAASPSFVTVLSEHSSLIFGFRFVEVANNGFNDLSLNTHSPKYSPGK